MNFTGLRKTLPFFMKHKIPIFIWGSQGIGKTQGVEQMAKKYGLQFKALYTATQEVGDLVGLLVKDDKNKTAYHTRPEWFPTEGEGIIFLDELNLAPQEVLNAMFNFVLKGELHTHKLPPGWYVVAAGNYQNDRFNVTDTSGAAWMSRFLHIDFTPTVEEWLDFVEGKHGVCPTSRFIRDNPECLELSEKDAGRFDFNAIVPDRRAIAEKILPLDNDKDFPEELRYETYMGAVGTAVAARFMSYKKEAQVGVSITEILEDYGGAARKKVQSLSKNGQESRFDILNQPVEELFAKLENDKNLLKEGDRLQNLKQFLIDIPKELAVKVFSKITEHSNFYGKKQIVNDPIFAKNFA